MSMTHYPSVMVPYPGLNTEVEVDSMPAFAVARRVDRAFSDHDIRKMSDGSCVVRNDSDLREETFKRIPGMSMTMLWRADFLDYAKFSVDMKPETDDWKGSMIRPWCYRGRAEKPSAAYLMVYKLELLHGQPADYYKRFESKEDAKAVQDKYDQLRDDIVKSKFTKKTLYHGEGHVELKHSPTMLNYWHYELTLKNSEGREIKNAGKYTEETDISKLNMNQGFVTYVWENFLCKHFWVNENPCECTIPINCFYDDKTSAVKRIIASLTTQLLFTMVPIVK